MSNRGFMPRGGETFMNTDESRWETMEDFATDNWRMMEPSSSLFIQEREGRPILEEVEDNSSGPISMTVSTNDNNNPPETNKTKTKKYAPFFSKESILANQKRLEELEKAKKKKGEKKKEENKENQFEDEKNSRAKLNEIRNSKPRYQLSPEIKQKLDEEFGGLKREPINPDILKQDKLELFFQDADYVTDRKLNGAPVIRIIGLTQTGNTVGLCIDGFEPYFYALIPKSRIERFTDPKCANMNLLGLTRELNNKMNEKVTGHKIRNCISKIEVVKRLPLYRYHTKTRHYLKITTHQPSDVPKAKSILAEGKCDSGINYSVGEADIPFVLRFSANKNVGGCSWFSIDLKKVTEVNGVKVDSVLNSSIANDQLSNKFSRCQLELRLPEHAISPIHDKTDVPPLRLMAFDIECAGPEGQFPIPERDPIICMGVILYKLQDRDLPMNKSLFCVGDTNSSPGISKIQCGAGHPMVVKDKVGLKKYLFTLLEANPEYKTNKELFKSLMNEAISKYKVWDVESEAQMLLALRQYIIEYADPDYFVGYNSGGFDHPYTFNRSDQLGIGQTFREMSRNFREMSHVRDKIFESAAFGKRTNHELKCFGRHMFDVLLCAIRDNLLNLRLYNLNSVALSVVGKTKHELDHKQIAPMWLGENSNADTRKIVSEYCINDSQITYEILDKKCYFLNALQLAVVSGVPLDYILYRGQSIKTISKLLRESFKDNVVLPTFTNQLQKKIISGFVGDPNAPLADDIGFEDYPTSLSTPGTTVMTEMTSEEYETFKKRKKESEKMEVDGEEEDDEDISVKMKHMGIIGGDIEEDEELSYTGAIVLDPIRGMYIVPVATLDFTSLYPSIMISHNLCFTTQLTKWQAQRLNREDYEETPQGHFFIKSRIKEGLLPRILASYLHHRSIAKKQLANETDPFKKIVLDGRQNALKISANSVYGFTGALIGSLPCMAVSAGTTSYGRKALELVQQKLEQEFLLQQRFCYGPKPSDWIKQKVPLPEGVRAVELEEMREEEKKIWQEALEKPSTKGMRPIVIAGDTDSVMAIFPHCETIDDAMKLGSAAAAWITKNYFADSPPMNLAFEKIYCPGIWVNRKRYAAIYWSEKNFYKFGTFDKVDYKGLETVRRDNCQLVSEQMDRLLKKILIDKRPAEAILDVAETISAVRQEKVDPGLLVITKALSKNPEEYKPPQIHSNLALRLREIDPLTAPKCGDRVPYVIVEKGKNAKTNEKGEDPFIMMQKQIPIDRNYYLENQLRKPVSRILDVIMPGISNYLFDGCEINEKPKVNMPITSFFNKEGIKLKPTESQLKLAKHAGEKRKIEKIEQEEEKERTKSDYEPSNLTLEWARAKSKLNISEIKKEISKKHNVVVIKGSRYSSSNAFGMLQIHKCLKCGINVQQQPNSASSNQCCAICYPKECDCEENITIRDMKQKNEIVEAPLLCRKCELLPSTTIDNIVRPLFFQCQSTKEKYTKVWDTCLKCMKMTNIEEVESCANKSCKNWYTRYKSRFDLHNEYKILSRVSACKTSKDILKRIDVKINCDDNNIKK